MNVIWLSHFIPYPPQGGCYQRSYHLLRQVARRHRLRLIAFNLRGEGEESLAEYRAHLEAFCDSLEFWQLPLSWKGPRWWGRLALSPWMELPLAVSAFWSPERERAWQRVLAESPGALLHLDSSDLARFARGARGFRKVLNHHNCESAMLRRRAGMSRNPAARWYLSRQADKLQIVEKSVCHLFDANLTVSSEDAALLRQINPWAHFHVVENGTDVEFFRRSESAEQPRTLIFAASLDWYPNISALQYFRASMWPALRREVPGIQLEIAGRNPQPWMRAWAESDAQVILTANPSDIRPCIARAAVFVCPIIDGGGTRLKLLDAMAMGKAIVTTSIGCEGLRVNHGRELLVADDPVTFVAATVKLLEDTGMRQRLSEAARAFVVREYSWQKIGEELEAAYQCAVRDEKQLRAQFCRFGRIPLEDHGKR